MRVLPSERSLLGQPPADKDTGRAKQHASKENAGRTKEENGGKAKENSNKASSNKGNTTKEQGKEPNGKPQAISTPVPDSAAELPPVIRRQEVVAIALVGLLVIAIITVLYFAKAFFLPVVMAFVIGTMLSPAAGFLERYKIPRAVGSVLLVLAAGALCVFIVGLIASPAIEWSNRLPELGERLKDKLHIFDRPLALWRQVQGMIGGSDPLTTFHLPQFEWVKPTLEFLSPTFAEFLLFFATLLLFIASWKDFGAR